MEPKGNQNGTKMYPKIIENWTCFFLLIFFMIFESPEGGVQVELLWVGGVPRTPYMRTHRHVDIFITYGLFPAYVPICGLEALGRI